MIQINASYQSFLIIQFSFCPETDVMKLRTLTLCLATATAIGFSTIAASADATMPQTASGEALPLNWVIKQLARKGGKQLVEIGFEGGAYRATVRHDDGRLGLLTIDAHTGAIRPTDQGDILRNSFDLGVLEGLRGSVSGDLPDNARPAFEIVEGLMATGKYIDVRSLRVQGGVYRIVMIDKVGGSVLLAVDPVTGSLSGQGA